MRRQKGEYMRDRTWRGKVRGGRTETLIEEDSERPPYSTHAPDTKQFATRQWGGESGGKRKKRKGPVREKQTKGVRGTKLLQTTILFPTMPEHAAGGQIRTQRENSKKT